MLAVNIPQLFAKVAEERPGPTLVLPFSFLLVLLPPETERPERVHLGIAGIREELTVGTAVEEPVPVLLGDIRDEPGNLLAVEDDLRACTRLDEPVGIDQITVQLETGIVENKVDSTVLDGHGVIGELVKVVSKNVLLGRSEMFTTGRLELLDVLLGHVDQQRQVGRVAPQAD